jgi:TRAP-type mannitol/chloroaromatic compound transport system permease small subunit
MYRLRAISDGIDAVLTTVARMTGWLFLAAIFVICFDVITRKFGYQLPYFTSTRLQELQWHITSTLFLGWLAFGVIKNTHVRIDVFTMSLPQRTKDWVDLFGVVVFALPMGFIIVPYAWEYALVSWAQLESSDAPNGLPARYIIKTIAATGLTLLMLAAVSMFCRKIVDLFGPPEWHSSNKAGEGVEV